MFRYLNKKDHFLNYAYDALKGYFSDRSDFDAFFDLIPTDESKDRFLKTSSFYLFLVVKGRFKYSDPQFDEAPQYIDDTYKYIAIFSLVESLYVGEKFIDFYDYLIKNKNNVFYPISSRGNLNAVYDAYKKDYGAVRNAVKFFNGLDKRDKDKIIKKLRINDKESSITDLAKLLYQIRSDFVHSAKLVLGFGENIGVPLFSRTLS
jgi:hypothetical protein